MEIHIVTLFPHMFQGPLDESILRRAIDQGLLKVHLHNLRDFARDKHRTVDDYSFGGGPGMVMKPEPLFEAVETILNERPRKPSEGPGQRPPVILMTPQGQLLAQDVAQELASNEELILICGHYQGVDERVSERLVTHQISIGDYVLTGGELPALVLVDAVARLLPGVLGSEDSVAEDSFTSGPLQYPLYTRPLDFRGWKAPPELLSGNHAAIARWRRQQALLRTANRRPELLARAQLSAEEQRWLKSQQEQQPRPK